MQRGAAASQRVRPARQAGAGTGRRVLIAMLTHGISPIPPPRQWQQLDYSRSSAAPFQAGIDVLWDFGLSSAPSKRRVKPLLRTSAATAPAPHSCRHWARSFLFPGRTDWVGQLLAHVHGSRSQPPQTSAVSFQHSAKAEVPMAVISSPAASAAELMPVLPAPAAEPRQDLPGLDDRELLALAASLPLSSDLRAAARNLLVSRYRAMVLSAARRYSGTPEPAEDLIQVGYVGLLKAINDFNPAFGYCRRPTPGRAFSARSSGTSGTSDGRCTSSAP